MACLPCILSKFIVNVVSYPVFRPIFFACKSSSNQWYTLRRRRRGFLLAAFSMWGFSGKKTTKPNITEEVLHCIVLATIALKDGNIEKSRNKLLETLDFAEMNNFSMGVISICDMLSSLAIKFGDLERAANLLIKALDNLHSQGIPEDDNYVVSFNLKLSRIYSDKGNDDLAEAGFRNCLKAQQEKLKNDLDKEAFLLWTTVLYWYGKFLAKKNRFHEAKTLFKNCYLSSLKTDYILPSQIMVILYNLGETCEKLGEHDEAIEYFLSGVSLDKKQKNPDLTYFYIKLGVISMSKRLFKEAKLWCEKVENYALKHKNLDAQRESNKCLEKLNDVFVTQ